MNPVLLAFACGFVGGVVGALAERYDLTGWVLHLWARVLGAQWFSPRQFCPRCSRFRHLLRHDPAREGAWDAGDTGLRCLSCATSPRNAPQDAPGRTESPEGVGLRVLRWDGATEGTSGRSQARCICGPDETVAAPDCRHDCPLHGADAPYDPGSDTGEVPF